MSDMELSGAELAALATAREVRNAEKTLPNAIRKTAAQIGQICSDNDIPLHVVLEGLHEGYDAYSAEGVWLYQAGLKSRYLGDKGLAFVDLLGTVLTVKWLADVASATINGVVSLLQKLVPSLAGVGEMGASAMTTLMGTVIGALPFGIGTALRTAVNMGGAVTSNAPSTPPSASPSSGSQGVPVNSFSPSQAVGGSGTRVGVLRNVLDLTGTATNVPVYANSSITFTDPSTPSGSSAPGPNRRAATISADGVYDPASGKKVSDSGDHMFALSTDRSIQVISREKDSTVLNDSAVINDSYGSRARSVGVLLG